MFKHGAGVPVIDERTISLYANPIDPKTNTSTSGYMPKDPDFEAGVATAFPRELLIPEVEWAERYAEMKAKGAFLSEIAKRGHAKLGVKWLNQNPTNYCWCYAVVHAVMVLRLYQNEPYRRLVPASVAGPIKNYRNVGGWGSQALDYITEHGVADESVWPQETALKAIDSRYFEGSRENAATTKIKAWWRLKTVQEKMSCLFRHIPVPTGYLDMGHEMCSLDPYQDERGQWGSLEMDSYANNNGMYNQRIRMDTWGEDMVAPAVITAQVA